MSFLAWIMVFKRGNGEGAGSPLARADKSFIAWMIALDVGWIAWFISVDSAFGRTTLYLVAGLAVAVFGLVLLRHVLPRRPDHDEVKQTARYAAFVKGSAAVAWAGLAGVVAYGLLAAA